MKDIFFRITQNSRLVALAILIALVLLSSPLYADLPPHTDEELYDKARKAYETEDWITAVRFLTAFVERSPDALQSDEFAAQVEHAIASCLVRISKDREYLEKELSHYKEESSRYWTECWDQGCELVGIKFFAPPPEPPPPFPSWAPSARGSVPLVCRGGGNLIFNYTAPSDLSTKPHIQIIFDEAVFGSGYNGENLHRLRPGQCAFIDRGFRSSDPNTLVLGYPLIQPDEFSISWSAQGDVQLAAAPEFLRTLSTDESAFESFHAYDDGDGHWSATKVGFVIRSLEVDSQSRYELSHENLDGLQEGARVYTDQGYTYRSVPALLEGSTYIMTANNDMGKSSSRAFLTFQTNRDIVVYVAHDDRYTRKPMWLTEFRRLYENLVYHDGRQDVSLSLYEKEFLAGEVVLGGNVVPGEMDSHGMYAVVVTERGQGEGGRPSRRHPSRPVREPGRATEK